MHRVLIVECQQEVSSFNPVPSRYADFQVHRGAALLDARRGTGTYLGGALGVLEQRGDVEIVPVYGAVACSAGPLAADSFARLSGELLEALAGRGRGCERRLFRAARRHAGGGRARPGRRDPRAGAGDGTQKCRS